MLSDDLLAASIILIGVLNVQIPQLYQGGIEVEHHLITFTSGGVFYYSTFKEAAALSLLAWLLWCADNSLISRPGFSMSHTESRREGLEMDETMLTK